MWKAGVGELKSGRPWAKSGRPYLKNKLKQQRAGGEVQEDHLAQGPEFKPQHCQKVNIK
jgi:hypothetical protein